MLLPSYKVSVLHWDKVGSSEKSLLILEVVFFEGSHLVLLVELLEYERILVAGRNISLHHLGCLTKMPLGPLDENPTSF